MKRLLLLITLTLISLTLNAQKIITKQFKLSNGVTKAVKIFIPEGYSTDTILKYPMAIVLNSGHLFDLTIGTTRLLAKEDIGPKQIVIGIPTNMDENKDVSFVRKTLGLTNNALAFYKFIKNDLIKYLKATYKVSPFRSIVAEGRAAEFASYFIDEPKPTFNSYVCLNPTLSEKSNKLISSYKFKKIGSIDNSYFLYYSQSPFKSKESQEAFKQLESGLNGYKLKNFKIRFDSFEDSLNGISNVGQGLTIAFSEAFNLYQCITDKEYEEKVKDLDPLSAIEYLEKKYMAIDFLYGTNINVRLKDFYKIEGIVSEQEEGDYLRVLGDFALIKHPNEPLGDYYMGKYHELIKDYEMADSYYKTGYGKIDHSKPAADSFYKNIERIQPFLKQMKEKKKEQRKNQEKGLNNEQQE